MLFKKVKFSSPVELSSKQTSLNDRWFMLENKKIKYSASSSSGCSQQQRNRNISEIILEFDKEHVNLIETVVVLDFDTGFKDLVADAVASSPSTLLASKNVLDFSTSSSRLFIVRKEISSSINLLILNNVFFQISFLEM